VLVVWLWTSGPTASMSNNSVAVTEGDLTPSLRNILDQKALK
jgi:hypothetical protein